VTRGIDLASGRLVLLSDDDIAHAHETSLKILQEIRIKVLSKKVQNLLAENGAEVDSAHSITKIPSSLVEEAVKKAPEETVLRGRNPKSDLKIPAKDFPFVGLNGCSAFMRDFETACMSEKHSLGTRHLRSMVMCVLKLIRSFVIAKRVCYEGLLHYKRAYIN
jgi:trimethylamine:corrinoid methyltransferase-like protein